VGRGPGGSRLLYLIFFLSGASGLVYQVVWVREFGNVFGNTIHSASLVIAIFMCGLGVGSYLAGRWADHRYADRPASLLAAYGWVELAIAGAGLLVTLLLPQLGEVSAAISWYTRDAEGWYVLALGSSLTRYAIAVLLLTPVTLLMGGTLTLLIRHCVQRDLSEAGWRIGVLYGINTAGAALGAFLCDYLLIPHIGRWCSSWAGWGCGCGSRAST
jgi:spermidine synthase